MKSWQEKALYRHEKLKKSDRIYRIKQRIKNPVNPVKKRI